MAIEKTKIEKTKVEKAQVEKELNKKLSSYMEKAPRQILKYKSYRSDLTPDFQRLTEACIFLLEKNNIQTIDKIGLLHTLQETLDNNWSRIEKEKSFVAYKDSNTNKIPEDIFLEWVNYIKKLIKDDTYKEKALLEGKVTLIETWELLEYPTLECAKESLNIEEIINATLTELEKPHTPKWKNERELPNSNIKTWKKNLSLSIKNKTPNLLSQNNIKKILELHPNLKISPLKNASSIRYVSKEVINALEPLEIKKYINSFLDLKLINKEQLNILYDRYKNESNPDKCVRDFLIENS